MAKTGGAEYYSVTSFALTLYIFCSHTIVLRPSRFGHGAFCVLADIFFPNDERSRQKMSRQKSARSFCPAFKVTAINRRMCSGQPLDSPTLRVVTPTYGSVQTDRGGWGLRILTDSWSCCRVASIPSPDKPRRVGATSQLRFSTTNERWGS
jgi:hypothetical protein